MTESERERETVYDSGTDQTAYISEKLKAGHERQQSEREKNVKPTLIVSILECEVLV